MNSYLYVAIVPLLLALPFIIRYYYIYLLYWNLDVYFWYKRWYRWIKHFLKTIKKDLTDEKVDITKKIKLIKDKLKELTIKNDLALIQEQINKLDGKTSKNYEFFLNSFKELEENIIFNIDNQFNNDDSVNNIKSDIDKIWNLLEDVNESVEKIDKENIYRKVSEYINNYIDNFKYKKELIQNDIYIRKENIKRCNSDIEILNNDNIEIEKKSVFSATKSNQWLQNLLKKINNWIEKLGTHILGILKLWFALLLFVWDIFATYKLWWDLYANQIHKQLQIIDWLVSYKVFWLVISLFIPLLFFFLFELIIEKSRQWNKKATFLEYLMIFFTVILVIFGLSVLFISRILPEIPFNFEPLDVIMMSFFVPAALIVAYIYNDLKAKNNWALFLFSPIILLFNVIIYIIVLLSNMIRHFYNKWYKLWANKNQKKILEDEITRNEKEIEKFNNEISILKDEIDTKMILKIKELLAFDKLWNEINWVLSWFDIYRSHIDEWFNNIQESTKDLSNSTTNLNIKLISEQSENDKLRKKLEKKIKYIEQWFELSMNKHLFLD